MKSRCGRAPRRGPRAGARRAWSLSCAAIVSSIVAVGDAGAQSPGAEGEAAPPDGAEASADTPSAGFALELVAGVQSGHGDAEFDGPSRDEWVPGLLLGTRWSSSLERAAYGYSLGASLSDSVTTWPARATGPLDDEAVDNQLTVTLLPEGRVYLARDRPIFAFAEAEVIATLESERNARWSVGADTTVPGSARIGAGLGAGRIVAIDPVVRLKRLERMLAQSGHLRAPIPRDVGSDVIRTWYALRNDLGSQRTLAHTMERLAQADLVSAPMNTGATLGALAILADPYALGRHAGWDARVGMAYVHDFTSFGDGPPINNRNDWVPSFAWTGSARVEQPIGTNGQFSARFRGLYEIGERGDASQPGGVPDAKDWGIRGSLAYMHAIYARDHRALASATLSVHGSVTGGRLAVPLGVPDPLAKQAGGGLEITRPISGATIVVASVGYAVGESRRPYESDEGPQHEIRVNVGFRWVIATGFLTPYVVPAGL